MEEKADDDNTAVLPVCASRAIPPRWVVPSLVMSAASLLVLILAVMLARWAYEPDSGELFVDDLSWFCLLGSPVAVALALRALVLARRVRPIFPISRRQATVVSLVALAISTCCLAGAIVGLHIAACRC